MEEKTETGDATCLIDFNSPVLKRTLHTPLIPVPVDVNINHICVSPSDTDPFDMQTRSPEAIDNDPFECVSQITSTNLKTTDSSANDKNSNSGTLGVYKVIESKSDNVTIQQETVIEQNKGNCDSRLLVEFEKANNLEMSSVDREINAVETNRRCPLRQGDNSKSLVPGSFESSGNVLLRQGDDGISQISGDFSTEEGIKATIAKRVNKCIEKVLSNSMIKSTSDEEKNEVKYSRKSASFTTNYTSNKVCDRLNKSCSDPASTDDSFVVVNHDLNTPDTSVGSCDITPFSFMDLKNDDSVFLTSEKDEVFQEANKLARTFSKIANSFSKNTGEADDDDDLLSCKPQWLYADSSEDEEERLKKDPALNIRVSTNNTTSQNQPDLEALSAITRFRRSFSHLNGNASQNESTFKRSLSIGSKSPIVAATVPPVVSTSAPIILDQHDDNLLKLKKKPVGGVKKGPMRAVMPIQTMAKESLTTNVQSAGNRATSPVKKKNLVELMISPIKDTSQISMHPVASSTPNKCSAALPKMLVPALLVPKNKRRSLGSSIDNRKSRSPLVDSGPRQRSNSANSSIPKPTALPVRELGPKSLSNLMRNSPTAKVYAHQDKESDKKTTKQTKTSLNPKALNAVKPKIVRPSRVRTTVNAISSMITGKNKRGSLQDKENRFPE